MARQKFVRVTPNYCYDVIDTLKSEAKHGWRFIGQINCNDGIVLVLEVWEDREQIKREHPHWTFVGDEWGIELQTQDIPTSAD